MSYPTCLLLQYWKIFLQPLYRHYTFRGNSVQRPLDTMDIVQMLLFLQCQEVCGVIDADVLLCMQLN